MIHKIGLTERHELTNVVSETIFPFTIDRVFDLDGLEIKAFSKLKKYKGEEIYLYTTGLTQALISTINVCKLLDITLTLYHYDKVKETYLPQRVL